MHWKGSRWLLFIIIDKHVKALWHAPPLHMHTHAGAYTCILTGAHASCFAAFWQAFLKSAGSSGSGARKLEVAVFGAMAGIALVGWQSVDMLWRYKNKGGWLCDK